jgi:uncharacterized protein YycO
MSYTYIQRSAIRKADIILSTTGATVSGAIRTGIGASVSHAGLAVNGNVVIEAVGDGVREVAFDHAYHDASLIMVLRRRNMTEDIKNNVVSNARNFVGLPYDKIGAVGSGTTNARGRVGGFLVSPLGSAAAAIAARRNASASQRDTAFFCSELVARAFELAGAPITGISPSYANPRTLRTSTYLMYIGHVVAPNAAAAH